MAISYSITSLLSITALLWIFYRALYNLYLHPLGRVPGPKLWIVFPLLRHWAALQGELENRLVEYHRQHGDVVRFSVNELSFTGPGSMRDIYSSFPHRPALPKALPTSKNVVQANNEDHARYRKMLSQAFSDKALRAQEVLIRPYVDLLVSKLHDAAASDTREDMVKWYNLTTFDIFGELTFRESFHGLKDNAVYSWISGTLQGLKLVPLIQLAFDYPVISRLLRTRFVQKLVPQSTNKDQGLRKSVHQHLKDSSIQTSRGDFFEALLKNHGTEDGLVEEEIYGNISSLLLAASETSATCLSGMTYYLSTNPAVLSKVVTEVRTAFSSPDDITFQSTATKLPYLQACIDEAMRLYPPVPMGISRRTAPDGLAKIGSLDVPGSTKVVFHQAAAYISPNLFHRSDEYIPERWMREEKRIGGGHQDDRCDLVQPFSVGPRSCIGRSLAYCEIRLIAALILFHFDLELCEESRHWRRQKVFLIWQKPPLWCKVKSRLVRN